jgi:hypothetical protein
MLRAQQFAKANQTAAAVILEDPALYGGDAAGLVQWARLVLDIAPAERCAVEGARREGACERIGARGKEGWA